MVDVACLLSDAEATDPDIKEKSDAWQVMQRVTLKRRASAEDCCLLKKDE